MITTVTYRHLIAVDAQQRYAAWPVELALALSLHAELAQGALSVYVVESRRWYVGIGLCE